MNEITRENFSLAYPKLKQLIQTGSFVAIDFEFLGLPQNSPSTTPSILDSTGERFRKNLESVKKYPPCQMGLTIYTEKGDGRCYDVYVYRIYLFKEIEGQHQAGLSYSSVSFLKRHDFDFNRWVKNGVTYANMSEEQEIRLKLENGVVESGLFDEAFTAWMEALRIHVDFKIACEPDVFNSEIILSQENKEVEIELCKTSKTVNSKELLHSSLWDRPLSKLESCAVLYDLTSRFPSMEFRIVKGQTLHMKRCTSNEPEKRRKEKVLNDFMHAISGASSIIQCISENKIPIIMHNASLDLLYLYQYFIDDLREDDYSNCKREIHRAISTVIDTKCLAVMCTGLVRDHRPGLLGKLGCLRNYVELYGNNNPEDYFSSKVNLLYANDGAIVGIFWKHVSTVEVLWKLVRSYTRQLKRALMKAWDEEITLEWLNKMSMTSRNERKLISHDAAFDSMVAGEIFLKLSHLFILARSSRSKSIPRLGSSSLTVKQLLYHLRPFVVNKISLPYAISPIMYLAGEDEHPEYSYQLMVRKTNARFAFVEWFPLCTARISLKEELQLRSLISKAGNPWKCDFRVIENRTRILVAASGHDVYAKVYNLLSANSMYTICDSAKFYKNAGIVRSPSPARQSLTSASIYLSLTTFMGRLVPFPSNIFMYISKCRKAVNRKPFLYFFSCFNLCAVAFLGRKLFLGHFKIY